jgi:hypothetical protein
MTNNLKHPVSTNLNRFAGILEAIRVKLPASNYEIKGFFGDNPVSKLKPQSFCTKLREAYNEAVELGIQFPCEVSFRFGADSVTAFPTGQPRDLEQMLIEPRDETIKAAPNNLDDVLALARLCSRNVFNLPVEVAGTVPEELNDITPTTQLAKTYLIH